MASELKWTNVEVEGLNERNQANYSAAKEAYKLYKAARDAFEAGMQHTFGEHLAEGTELKFGYNFGKLSIAVGPKTARKAKAGPKQGLADWLAEQSGEGRGS